MASDRTPTGPVRASDADRERAAEVIRDAAAAGRLTLGEADERMAAVYAARYVHDLAPLTADVPAPAPPARPTARRRPLPGYLAGYVALSILLVTIWAVTGAGYFWPVWPILGVGVKLLARPGLFGHGWWGWGCGSRRATRGW
jgi:Domain of unknown function (DUF1707)